MTIQEVKVVREQSDNWAQEATLKKLLDAAQANNDVMKRVATRFQVNMDGIEDLDKSASKTGQTTKILNQGLTQTSRTVRDYQSAVWDLQRTTQAWSRRLEDGVKGLRAAPGLADMMASAGSKIQNLGTSLMALGGARGGRLGNLQRGLGMAATGFGMLASTSAAVVGQFIEAGDTFRNMIDNGVIFDGTVSGMIQSVRRTGMSLENASQLIQSHSEAILVTGEQRFFNSVTLMSDTFTRMGMDANRGAEALANLTEIQRLNGSLFVMSEQQRIAANTTLLNQMHAQSRLTGISLRRQQDEQAALNRRERVRILKAGMSPEQLARIQAQESAMLNMGMTQDVIEAAMLEAFEGLSTQTGGMARNLFGIEYDRILQQLRSGETIGGIEQQTAVRSRIQGALTGEQRALALRGTGPYAEFVRATALPALERTQAGTQAIPGQERELELRQAEAARAMQGQAMLADSTVNLYKTQYQIAEAMGTLQGMLAKAAQGPVALFLENTSKAADAALRLVRTTESRGLDAMLIALEANLLRLAASNPEVLVGLAALGLGGGLAGGIRPGGAPPGSAPGAASGAGALPAAMVAAGATAGRAVGNLLGIEQLLSAYNSYSQGNYLEMMGHLGLAAYRNSPVGRVLSLADFITEVGTGQGVVSRAAGMLGRGAGENSTQDALSAAAAAQLAVPNRAPLPAVPATGALTPEQAVALEAQTQTLAARIGEMQSRGADARNQELIEAIRQLTENQSRLLLHMRGVERNTQ